MKTNLIIALIGLIVAGAAGYFAYDYGHQQGIKEALDVRSTILQDPQRFPATAPTGGANRQGGGQFPQGGQTNNPLGALFGGVQGTVDKIEGNTLTVTVTRGQQTQQVKVNLDDKTAVETFTQGSINDVKVGSRILVGLDRQQAQRQATPGAQGTGGQAQIPSEVTARTITVLPASFGP